MASSLLTDNDRVPEEVEDFNKLHLGSTPCDGTTLILEDSIPPYSSTPTMEYTPNSNNTPLPYSQTSEGCSSSNSIEQLATTVSSDESVTPPPRVSPDITAPTRLSPACSTPNTSKTRPLTREPTTPVSSTTETPSGSARSKQCYFGVYVPLSLDETDSSILADSHVFTDRVEALKLMKKNKESRFKCFTDQSDAVNFAMGINSSVIQSPGPQQRISTPEIRQDPHSPKSPVSSETLPFRAPKTQDLSQLRKAIEANKVEFVREVIWENPRCLISNGDTPTIVQEGFRYNVFHVSARSNKPEILSLLLSALENPAFYKLLYTQDTEEATQRRIDFLLDLYLNMPDRPDKGNGDTPLHFACKCGHVEIIKILTSHPKTDKNRKNKHGQKPIDVLGERVSCSEGVKSMIQSMFEDTYYVPLYRSEDETTPAMIGVPWSPDAKSDQSQPSFNSTDSNIVVKAYAGPMTPNKADEFHRRWTTPSQSSLAKKEAHRIRCTDTSKGFERIGRNVAHDMNIPWVEYWSFLGCCIDISSDKGLARLESHLYNIHQASTNTLGGSTDTSPKTPNASTPGTTSVSGTPDRSRQRTPNTFASPNLSLRSDGVMSSLANDFARLKLNTSHDSADYSNLTFDEEYLEQGDTLAVQGDVNNSQSNHGNMTPDGDTEYDDYSKHTFNKPKPLTFPKVSAIFGKMYDATKYVAGVIMGYNKEDDSQQQQRPTTVYFINGAKPSKLDVDVYRALSKDHVDQKRYPYISRWHHVISSFSDQEKKSWSSPAVSTRPEVPTPSAVSPLIRLNYSPRAHGTPNTSDNNIQKKLFISD